MRRGTLDDLAAFVNADEGIITKGGTADGSTSGATIHQRHRGPRPDIHGLHAGGARQRLDGHLARVAVAERRVADAALARRRGGEQLGQRLPAARAARSRRTPRWPASRAMAPRSSPPRW